MAYADFTLETVESALGVTVRRGVLFPKLVPSVLPDWLPGTLKRGAHLALTSEKARSEFLVAPVLLALRELSGDRVSILSGHRMDVDPSRSLVGECDFILSLSEPIPRLKAPVIAVVEAKKNDIDLGLGQCIAQMVAAQMFNERSGDIRPSMYGCVTTGEDWQFLGLTGNSITIDQNRLFIINVDLILGTLQRAIAVNP